MRLVPVTYRAKRIRGKLAWVNVYALTNVGCAAGAVIVAGAAVSMLGSGVARADPPCGGGSGTISAAGTTQSWSTGNCTITNSGAVTLNNTVTSGSNVALQAIVTTGTLTNSGTIVNNLTAASPTSAEAVGLANIGTVTTIQNNAGGLIAGDYAGTMSGTNNRFTITGLGNYTQSGTLATIGSLVNNGLISATNIGTFAASQLTVTSPGVTFVAVDNEGLVGTLTNNSTIAGTIGGSFTPGTPAYFPYGVGIENGTGATIANLTNATGALIRSSTTGIDSRGNIGTLTNNGTISGGLNGVFLAAGATINYFSNAGTILGSLSARTSAVGVWVRGTIGTLVNTGIISAQTGLYMPSSGSIGTLTNQGTIAGGDYRGLYNSSGTIQVLNNSGLITTAASTEEALYNRGFIGALTNSGTISSSASTATLRNNGTIGTLTNSGLISAGGTEAAVGNFSGGSIGTLSNSGTISGNNFGIYNYYAQLGSLVNTTIGTISAAVGSAIENYQSTIGTLSNSGTIHGGLYGVRNDSGGVITSFDNAATGVLTATAGAAFNGIAGSSVTTFSNEGLISGGTAGVKNAGLISQLSNSGTITATHTGQYAAIINSGSIGTLTNSGTIAQNTLDGIMNTGGTIGTLSNSGLIQAPASVIYNAGNGTIVELDNLAGGTISSANTPINNWTGSTIVNINNFSLITGSQVGLSNHGSIGTLTNSGTLVGQFDGIYIANVGTLGSINNTSTGTIYSGGTGIYNNGGTIGTVTNQGVLQGHSVAILNAGFFDTLDNSGLISNPNQGDPTPAIANNGVLLDLLNEATGTIQSGAVAVSNNAYIGTISNSGLITSSGANTPAIDNGADIVDLTNTATGTIQANWTAIKDGGSIGTLSNAGLIRSTNGYTAIMVAGGGTVGVLTNSGTLTGWTPLAVEPGGAAGTIVNDTPGMIVSGPTSPWAVFNAGTVGSMTNNGTISLVNAEATGRAAIYNSGNGVIGTLTNNGMVTSTAYGIANEGATIGSLINSATGTITTTGTTSTAIGMNGPYAVPSAAVYNDSTGTLGTIVNDGLISGPVNAITNEGAILSLSNSGTISGGTNNGLGNTGSIASVSNTGLISGVYGINSTGSIGSINNAADATISGGTMGLYNSGTIGTVTNAGVMTGDSVGLSNDGTIDSILNTGTISDNFDAGLANTGTITSLANQGVISGASYGLNNQDGYIGSLSNSGTIVASEGTGLHTAGTIGTLTNSGLVSGTADGVFVDSDGVINSLGNSGSIGGGNTGNGVRNSGLIGSLVNSGTISGGDGVNNAGTITDFSNLASGVISGGGFGAGLNNSGSIPSVSNAGSISGVYGVNNAGDIGTISNSATGTISGEQAGIYSPGSIDVMTNAGVITGGGVGLYNAGTIGSIVNTGTISDAVDSGLLNTGTITSLVSEGNIVGRYYGLRNTGTLGTLNNSGTIIASAHTALYDSGTIATLTNSGLITGTVVGLNVASNGVINAFGNGGVITGVTALAIASAGSLGTVTNSGTIAGAIHNLSANDLHFAGGSGETSGVFTGSSGGLGVADEGLISSTGSNVVFLGGNILLNDNINVGTNTVTNSAVLQVNNPLGITGNYHQTSAANLVLGVTGTSNYGNLQVSGTATIDANGNVSLTRLNGFSFAAGQTYTVVLAPTATYNVSTMNVAVSGYDGSTTVTQLQRGSEAELVICLGGATICSAGSSGGSSGGGSSGGGTTGGGTTGGGTTGGGTTTGGGSSGGTGSSGSSSTTTNHYSMATTPNAVAANNAVVGYTGDNESLINLANQVVSLGSSAAANNAGNQLRADSHGPSSQLALQPAMDVLNVVTAHSDETNLARLDSPSGVAAGENAAGWAPWSEVLGSTGHQSTEGQFAGYGLSTEGILFGADKTLTPEVRIGGLGSYTHASLTDHGDLVGDGTGLDNYGLFGYGTYVGARAYFDVSAGVMFDRFNTTRVVTIGDFSGAAFGKHNGLQEVVKGEGGYPFALNAQKTTTFSPLWGLGVMHLHQSAYDETGGSAAALAIGSSETWSVKSEVGGKLEHSIKATSATWVPELRVLWRHEFDRSATSQREAFLEDATGSTEFTTEGPRPEANTGLIEAGLTVLTHGDVTLAVRYQADVGSGYFDQGGRLRLRWDF